MKIITLTAENIKKLTAVEITPSGNLVQISGKNGQGKSSVLDAIWWALAGKDAIQSAPIRRGEAEALIRLDLGEIKVTRKFKQREDKSYTTSIVVENAEGARFPSPQQMIDSLLGEISFDPLAFSRMRPKDQFDLLKRFVPDVDFAAAESANKGDYEERANINRQAKQARTLAEQIQLPGDLPADPLDEGALVDELENIGQHNVEIEQRRSRREGAGVQAEGWESTAEQRCARAKELRAEADILDAEATEFNGNAREVRNKIAAAEPLPEPKSAADVRARLDEARRVNSLIEMRETRDRHIDEVERLEPQAQALTERMEAREREKREAVAAAKLPVDGIAFGDDEIVMDGVPFDQASDADKLRASVAIAMASNPKLHVLRIRDGSLLDEDSLMALAEMADQEDYQIWIERVSDTGAVGFVLEDGHLKGQEAPLTTEAAE